MGCISSKAITRSMSIREELSHGFQSRSAVWEELLTSHSANEHQLFAFDCSSNVHTHTPKLNTSSSFTFPSQANHLVDACNAKPDPQNDFSKLTRSKSCHTVGGNRLDLKDKSVAAGSRSFHTVEEYDALLLLERIRGTRSLECFDGCFPWDEEMKLQPGEDGNEEESSSVKSGENCEAGWKRKAVARGLKSLDISTPAPTPGIARMKQRMVVQGQIYSPGTYVTPKFGSYNDPDVRRRRQENAVFSPELVAAFEDCMQQLQVDEDSILRHIYG